MNTKVTLKSGAELEIRLADFEPASELLQILATELKAVNLEFSELNMENLLSSDINTVKNLVLQLVGSKALQNALFVCAEKCMINNSRITRKTFEDPARRADYLPAMFAVLVENMKVFIEGVDWLSSITPPSTPHKSE